MSQKHSVLTDQDLYNKSITIDPTQHLHAENHIQSGQYLKSTVYGGLDGVVNTLTVIIGGIAAGTSPAVILAIGLSVIAGDGLGMGLGDYLSAKAQKQFILSQQRRQLWEVQHKLQQQKREVIQIYMDKNYSQKSARRLADLFATNDKAFVNIMMLQQLGLVVDQSNPIYNGIITFLSFAFFGLIPLLPYVIGWGIMKKTDINFLLISLILAGILLFSIGWTKGILLGSNIKGRFIGAIETLGLGTVAVLAGYGIGFVFK